MLPKPQPYIGTYIKGDLAGVKVSELGVDKAEKLYHKAYQHLIDTDLCWQLQGRIGREAVHLINLGVCHANTKK